MAPRATAARPCTIHLTTYLCTLTFLTWVQTNAFQFYLKAGEKRCFTESAAPNSKVLGEYTVSTGKGRMPVDIVVRMEGQTSTLYSRNNVDHGKFAFVVPFDAAKFPHLHHAEMRRKLTENLHKVVRDSMHKGAVDPHAGVNHGDQKAAHQRRRLLSADEGHAPPPPHDAHDAHDAADHSNHRQRHHYHRDGHPHHDDEEDDDYDYEDDLDDFEMDDYDGIEDEELDEEIERNEQEEEKLHGRFEDASDDEKEDRLFDRRKFEICVVSSGERTGHKRRVRLMVNKGEMAHDFTRLAKKEHLTQLEVSLRQVSSELHQLMRELSQARLMEDVLRKRNEGTNKRVVILSVISLFCLFSVGGYQAFYTKKFFKRKKIL